MFTILSSKPINPCPLCGREIALDRMQIDIYWARHHEKTDCNLGHVAVFGDTEEEAIAQWNSAIVRDGKVIIEDSD